MDGAEEALVTQAHKADGEVLPGEGDDGAVGHGLPPRVHAEIELLLLDTDEAVGFSRSVAANLKNRQKEGER